MHRTLNGLRDKGFALPTVLIASVVLLTVLAVSVSATATVRTTLKNQYYAQLAQVAGEAGVAYAKACLAANGNVPQWTNAKPLTPATDCSGNLLLGAQVKALIVAGGGSGGGSTGGGGGAGGVIENNAVDISVTNYNVSVGNGGASVGQQTVGNNGGNSSFNGITATGGGGGGWSGPSAGGGGRNGGSGGGGQNYYGSYAGGTGIAGQGFAGAGGGVTNGGGGGGAGGPGIVSNTANVGGIGGPGVISSITGASLYYGGGGGGGYGGAGGAGGGANSAYGDSTGRPGTANTGGGGSGGWAHSGGVGGAGGSGIVVISHPANSGTDASITGAGNTKTTVGPNIVYKFITSGNFNVTSASSGVCPTDPRCAVTVNGNVRSSFTIGLPSLNSEGKAVAIPNNGYVDILRTSNGSIWRTYRQPAVQVSVVPDLCSAATTSAQGWANSVLTTTQDSFAPLSSAQTISVNASGVLNAGPIFFRKDFAITSAGNYKLDILTASSADKAEMFVGGDKIATSLGSFASGSTYFDVGCQSVVVELTNNTIVPKATRFTASIQKQSGGGNVIGTDESWRVSAGTAAHFSSTNFYAAPSLWKPVRKHNQPGWADNLSAEGITTTATSGVGYAFFIDKRTISVSVDTPIRTAFACTFSCQLYLDGKLVGSGGPSAVSNYYLTLPPGDHKLAMKQYGNGAGPYFYFSAFRSSDNAVLSQSDLNWLTSDTYVTDQDINSYNANFLPQPNQFGTGTVSVLVVGGGGGGGTGMGGGGGGGGVVTNTAYTAAGIVNVVVGNGGSGAPTGAAGAARGKNGEDSSFGNIVAIGGGGGGSDYSTNGSPPSSGASGGGVAGAVQTTPALGILGQGNRGGLANGNYYPGGGGGAGGIGTTGASGQPAHGGIGVANNILGTNYYWGGGGGGSGYTAIGGNGGNGGGGGGAVGTTSGGAGYNPGSSGGGGTTVAITNRPGGDGGANTGGGGGGGSHHNSNNYGGNGGSGIVIVSYPTASGMSASGGIVTTNGANTVHTFTSSGQFVIGKTAPVDTVMAAGGGGGGANHGGGGGGGGVVEVLASRVTAQSYVVVVGNGGVGATGTATGGNGGNSSFNGITAIGGGGGGARITTGVVSVPTVGGSGGGGAGTIDGTTGVAGVGRPGIPGQGNAGGGGSSDATAGQGGGGGGAATAGGAGTGASGTGISGAGGAGRLVSLGGYSTYLGGGGSGGRWAAGSVGAAGIGGGGTGGATPAAGTAGQVNTGGGGGGSGNNGGGAGGSGIVGISYTTGTMYATGGEITVYGNKTLHTFRSTGVFTVISIP